MKRSCRAGVRKLSASRRESSGESAGQSPSGTSTPATWSMTGWPAVMSMSEAPISTAWRRTVSLSRGIGFTGCGWLVLWPRMRPDGMDRPRVNSFDGEAGGRPRPGSFRFRDGPRCLARGMALSALWPSEHRDCPDPSSIVPGASVNSVGTGIGPGCSTPCRGAFFAGGNAEAAGRATARVASYGRAWPRSVGLASHGWGFTLRRPVHGSAATGKVALALQSGRFASCSTARAGSAEPPTTSVRPGGETHGAVCPACGSRDRPAEVRSWLSRGMFRAERERGSGTAVAAEIRPGDSSARGSASTDRSLHP